MPIQKLKAYSVAVVFQCIHANALFFSENGWEVWFKWTRKVNETAETLYDTDSSKYGLLWLLTILPVWSEIWEKACKIAVIILLAVGKFILTPDFAMVT